MHKLFLFKEPQQAVGVPLVHKNPTTCGVILAKSKLLSGKPAGTTETSPYLSAGGGNLESSLLLRSSGYTAVEENLGGCFSW